jgi:hypothetical protein
MNTLVTGDLNSCPGKASRVETRNGVAIRKTGAHDAAAHWVTQKRSLEDGDSMAFRSMGYHRTASGRKYDLQFDPESKQAQALVLPKRFRVGHVVLAFRAESEGEALRMLVEALDSASYF